MIPICFQHSGKKSKTQIKKHERVSYTKADKGHSLVVSGFWSVFGVLNQVGHKTGCMSTEDI